MKKLVFLNLSLFLLFLPVQHLNLDSLKAEPASEIVTNPHITKLLDTCRNNKRYGVVFIPEFVAKIATCIKTKLMCICNLSEKLQLRDFTKTPALFGKLFDELVKNVCNMLKIEHEKVEALVKNMQLSNEKPAKPTKKSQITNADKKEIAALITKILGISGNKLNTSITLTLRFLNPSSKKQISQKEITGVLTQTLSAFTSEELTEIEKIVSTAAFAKIATNLDILTETVLQIIEEA